MAEGILCNIAEGIIGKLGSLALQEIQLSLGFQDDLEKLENTISTIRFILLDAEEQQVKSHAVRDWLRKLKDALYDADDVFDDLSAEALRQKVENYWSIAREVRNFFFRRDIGRRVKEISERLDEIVEERIKFQFREQIGYSLVGERVETFSFVRFSEVLGREKDKEAIIQLLLINNPENISVIPIVGMGGLGKTTLAQLVYNDDWVKGHFSLRMWVCVSDGINVKKIVRRIIEAATGADCADLDMDQLHNRLLEALNGQRFLLVLDDAWNENRVEWVKLRDLLTICAVESKILVTTRSKNVALVMGTVNSYRLAGLPDDDCWSLFENWAFKEGEGKRYPNLVSIGKGIVQKCGGVPLALRTLGSLLYLNMGEHYWLFVKNSKIWDLAQKEDDILPVLRFSYDQMPSHLKHCFAYCSLFPKNHEIDKETLIQLWMAEGFIQSSDQNQSLEYIGNMYFNDLLSRSFFEIVRENKRAEILKCKMHDLLHDLAQSVAGTECFVVNFDTLSIPKGIRHVSFHSRRPGVDAISFLKMPKLRTLILPFGAANSWKSFLDAIALTFTYLHVLDLSYFDIKDLPSSIGNLKHLRYLNLQFNSSLKFLPGSICKLHNLQTLKLLGCLQIQNLPHRFGNLVSLRYLVLNSPKMLSWETQIAGLTSLQSLKIVHCDNLVSLSEGMQSLTALRVLHIRNCGKLAYLPSSMKNLTALEDLEISDCSKISLSEESIQGLSSLRSLAIKGLPKLVALPQGLERSTSTLQYLLISDCHSLMTLPDCLGNLTSLRWLYIICCHNLLCLPEGLDRLTALQVLHIDNCPYLSTRCQRVTGEDWSKIAHVPEIYVDKIKM